LTVGNVKNNEKTMRFPNPKSRISKYRENTKNSSICRLTPLSFIKLQGRGDL
jgi:hypothetical protein